MSRVTKFEELVELGSRFLVAFQQGLATVVQNFHENLWHLQDQDVDGDLDFDATINNKEELLPSDLRKPNITDYAALTAVIYGIIKQDYKMQGRIVYTLSLKSSSGELESLASYGLCDPL